MTQVRYNYRLRVSPPQDGLLQGVFDTNRFVWNQTLGRWRDLWSNEGLSYDYKEANKELTDWRSRFGWLAEQPSVSQQQVIRDLYKSIAAFFDKSNPASRPRFKRAKDEYSTARWVKTGFGVSGSGFGINQDDSLQLATSKGRIDIRVVWSRPLPAEPTSVTIYRNKSGLWYVSFVVEVEVPQTPSNLTGASTGLDVGLTTFATTPRPNNRYR